MTVYRQWWASVVSVLTKTPVSTPGADYQPAPGVEEFLLFLLLLLPWYALSVNVLSSLFRSMLMMHSSLNSYHSSSSCQTPPVMVFARSDPVSGPCIGQAISCRLSATIGGMAVALGVPLAAHRLSLLPSMFSLAGLVVSSQNETVWCPIVKGWD